MRLVFMGTPEAAVATLGRCVADGHEVVAVWTQPDRPAGRGNKISAPPVKEFARARGIPVHQPAKIRTAEALELFASHGAEAAVVVAYGRILPPAFLRTPPMGCVNVHFSLLPKYRGAAPVNWAIVRGESETGVTTMLMDEGLDTGPILRQRTEPIGDSETAPELMARLAEVGADLLSETLYHLKEIEPRRQNEAEATFAPVLTREDGRLNWDQTAPQLARVVRGLQPWPGAYAEQQTRRLIIWRAEVATPETGTDRVGGEIIEARGDRLVVACGGGTALRLLEVQPETRRRMTARDFLNGVRLQAGERLS